MTNRPSPGAASLERCADYAKTIKNIMSSSQSEILPFVARSGGPESPNSLRHYESRISELESDNRRLIDKLLNQRENQKKEIQTLKSSIDILEEGRHFLMEETRNKKSDFQQKTTTMQSTLTDLQTRQDSIDVELQKVLSTPPKRQTSPFSQQSNSPVFNSTEHHASTPERILHRLKEPLPIAAPSQQNYSSMEYVVRSSPGSVCIQHHNNMIPVRNSHQSQQQLQQQSYPPTHTPSFSQKLNSHKMYLADELHKHPDEVCFLFIYQCSCVSNTILNQIKQQSEF